MRLRNNNSNSNCDLNRTLINQIVNLAQSNLGKRYIWGATNENVKKTGSSSGFTSYAYKKIGVKLPRSLLKQSKYGQPVSRTKLKKGDLVFFDTSKRRKGVNLVGIYIGNSKFTYADPTTAKVVMSDLNDTFYKERYKLARRIPREVCAVKYK